MAYRRPAVTVTQEFVGLQPALAAFSLPNCIIGPAFSIVRDAAAGSISGNGSDVSLAYPGLLVGQTVDLSAEDPSFPITSRPVSAKATNVMVTIESAQTYSVAGTMSVSSANAKEGDKIVVASGDNAGTYTVRSASGGVATLTTPLADPTEPSIVADLVRKGADTTLESDEFTASSTAVTILAGLKVGGYNVRSADFKVSYRALRNDLAANVREFSRLSDLQAFFGVDQIHPQNTLAYGLQIALQNTVTPVNGLGLNEMGMADEVLAHQAALDVLTMTEMYALAPLTQSPAVASIYKSHVESMSTSARAKERIVVTNRKLLTVQTLSAASFGTVSADGTKLTNPSASFITDGIAAGMFVQVSEGAPHVGRHKIGSVISETELLFQTPLTTTSSATAVSFVLNRDMTRSEQAEFIASYSRSLGSRRVVSLWPDELRAPVANVLQTVPGYFGACAIVALVTGLPTQQGFTNLAISGFLGLNHSTKYFNEEQLDTIAGGGTMILSQDGPEQPLFIRHQLTTDTSAIKFQELSLTKNVDFASKFIRNQYKPYIGRYNIVNTTLDELRTTAKSIITFLSETTRLPRVGAVIRGGQLKTLAEDPTQIDTVRMRFKLDFPVPLNNIDITIEA